MLGNECCACRGFLNVWFQIDNTENGSSASDYGKPSETATVQVLTVNRLNRYSVFGVLQSVSAFAASDLRGRALTSIVCDEGAERERERNENQHPSSRKQQADLIDA